MVDRQLPHPRMAAQTQRQARNEALLREVNERLERVDKHGDAETLVSDDPRDAPKS
jgi:hypothetical protein